MKHFSPSTTVRTYVFNNLFSKCACLANDHIIINEQNKKECKHVCNRNNNNNNKKITNKTLLYKYPLKVRERKKNNKNSNTFIAINVTLCCCLFKNVSKKNGFKRKKKNRIRKY